MKKYIKAQRACQSTRVLHRTFGFQSDNFAQYPSPYLRIHDPRSNKRAAGCWNQLLGNTQARRSFVPGIDLNSSEEEQNSKEKSEDSPKSRAKDILIKCLETAGITLASLSMLALAGWGYQELYQKNSVKKIEAAFKTGDPAFALSVHSNRTGELDGW